MIGISSEKPKPEIMNQENQQEHFVGNRTIEEEQTPSKYEHRNGIVKKMFPAAVNERCKKYSAQSLYIEREKAKMRKT